MNILFLESFVAVADCGSIAAAARRLNVTPAALSQRLRTLERDFGHALVTRVGRTVRPTNSGLAVLRHARTVIEGAHELRAIAANDQPVGRLRLGATATSLTGLLPEILSRMRVRHLKIEYFLLPGSSVDLYNGVLARELDAAMIVRPHFPQPKSLGWLTIRQEPLILIGREELDLSDPHRTIAQQPFIRYDRNQWGGQIVERYLKQHKLEVNAWLELDALDAIAALVSRGLGVAIVPNWAPPWPKGLSLSMKPLPMGEVRYTGVLWNRSSTRIAAVRALLDVCAEVGHDGVLPD